MNPEQFTEAGWATESWQKPAQGKLAVFFHREQKKHEANSTKQGRPVYVEKIMITKIPADQNLRVTRPIRESDKDEFPVEWARFERTGESRVLGTPIEHWHGISDTQKAEFKAAGIHTVEQLANAPDAFMQKWMGGSDIRRKAQVFVESGKDAELVAKIKAESEAKITALETKMAEMMAQMEQLTAPKAK